MPERSTAWKLLAKGITAETLAGEATEALAVKKDLFGQLKLPLSFTDGDEAEILASVHNDAVDKGPIEVTLKTTIGGRTRRGEEDDRRDGQGHPGGRRSRPTLDRPEPAKDDKAAEAAAEAIVALRVDRRGRRASATWSGSRARCALRHAGLRHGQRLGHERHDRLGRAAARA